MSTDTNTGDDQNGPGTGPQSGQEAPNGSGQGEGTPDPHAGSQAASGSAGTQPRDAAGGPDPDSTGTGEGTNGEAAARRRQLRTAEAERDTLRARVETMQRADVERIAGEHLSVGGDLLALGTTLADVLDADGNVDADRVREAAAELVRARPGLRRSPTGQEVRAGIGQGGTHAAPAAGGTTWTDVLSRGR